MKRLLVRQVLLLLALAFLPAIGQAVYQRERIAADAVALTKNLIPLAQTEGWGDSVLWIDARPDEQFNQRHIPGALSLNEDRWNELLPQTLTAWSAEKHLVVYCSSQSCNLSHEVARRLREEAGLKNVYILQGGWEEWLAKNK